MDVNEMTSTFSYIITPAFHTLNMVPVFEDDAKDTFQDYDDETRLFDNKLDSSPLVCMKFFTRVPWRVFCMNLIECYFRRVLNLNTQPIVNYQHKQLQSSPKWGFK